MALGNRDDDLYGSLVIKPTPGDNEIVSDPAAADKQEDVILDKDHSD